MLDLYESRVVRRSRSMLAGLEAFLSEPPPEAIGPMEEVVDVDCGAAAEEPVSSDTEPDDVVLSVEPMRDAGDESKVAGQERHAPVGTSGLFSLREALFLHAARSVGGALQLRTQAEVGRRAAGGPRVTHKY